MGMGKVRVQINGRTYPISCEDGEEDHIRQLGTYLDAVVRNLIETGGDTSQITDTHLMLMGGLLVADELSDAYAKIEELGGGSAVERQSATATFEAMTVRLDAIASRLENS
jgi:cell division protein ZapA|tara:strand:+ start:54 stop:386 length:333 start_codon:yes stop_codon:yes gene_type:complete